MSRLLALIGLCRCWNTRHYLTMIPSPLTAKQQG